MAHNDVEETGPKRAINLIWARAVICCHLQIVQYDLKTKRHSILLVPVDDSLVT